MRNLITELVDQERTTHLENFRLFRVQFAHAKNDLVLRLAGRLVLQYAATAVLSK